MSYDAGLLNDYGGGNVEWWHNYIRNELQNSHDYYASIIENIINDINEIANPLEYIKSDKFDKDTMKLINDPEFIKQIAREVIKKYDAII